MHARGSVCGTAGLAEQSGRDIKGQSEEMMEIVQQIVTFFTAGLLIYFLQENLKAGRDAKNSASNNGDRLQGLHSDIEAVKNEMSSVISRLDSTMENINMWQKNLDRTFEINTDRHNELMMRMEEVMREQRKVQNTVDLEKSRLDSFSKAGIQLADRVGRNSHKVGVILDRINSMRRKMKELDDDEES